MTEKVIVNKVVAGWIEDDKTTSDAGKLFRSLLRVDNHALDKGTTMQKVMDEQNLDIVTLAKAIQFGFVVPYEFEVGDIASGVNSTEVVEVRSDNVRETERIIKVSVINEYKHLFKLVCKAEERRDLNND